jgi:hypothetical protein
MPMSGFDQNTIGDMVRDACTMETAARNGDTCVCALFAPDVACHVKALASEWERLRDKLTAVREALDKIVISEGIDAGVILLSDANPTHYSAEVKGQVYDHENFSELGDALVALAKLVKETET